MVRDVGYDVYGFVMIVGFIVCCLWGIDENWQLRFNGQFYINRERLITVLLTLFIALWQVWTAFNELIPRG